MQRKIKIIQAKNIGFCSGVKRAILIAERAIIQDRKPVQFLGDLVHNEKVVEKFKKKNVNFIKDPSKAKSGTLIIQAHGTAPFSPKNKKILIRDATCFLVKKVQSLAKDLCLKGFKVIIIGEATHPEVKGINGQIKNKALIIKNEAQAKKIQYIKKAGVVIQTTQRKENADKILNILKQKVRELKVFNTICPEVAARQKELKELLKKCETLLVIGSRSSANTRRMAEKANKLNKKVIWVNSLNELKKEDLKNISVLSVVSGTSAPDWEIKKIKKWLEEKQKQ